MLVEIARRNIADACGRKSGHWLLRSSTKDTATIAKELDRTQTAIRRRAAKLKLSLKVVTVELEPKARPKA